MCWLLAVSWTAQTILPKCSSPRPSARCSCWPCFILYEARLLRKVLKDVLPESDDAKTSQAQHSKSIWGGRRSVREPVWNSTSDAPASLATFIPTLGTKAPVNAQSSLSGGSRSPCSSACETEIDRLYSLELENEIGGLRLQLPVCTACHSQATVSFGPGAEGLLPRSRALTSAVLLRDLSPATASCEHLFDTAWPSHGAS